MASHINRSGGKFGGAHTTYIPIAVLVADIAATCETVTNISAGYISYGGSGQSNRKLVTFIDAAGGILIIATCGTFHQEIRIYTQFLHETRLFLARKIRDANIPIRFRSKKT